MKIYEILPRLEEVEIFGIADIEITDITEHSAHVSCGTAFACIKGLRDDGNLHIAEARLRGARVFISESKINIFPDEMLILSKNARKTSAEIANVLYGSGLAAMKIIGITGTKGKTTTAKMLSSCLSHISVPHVIIGTLGIEIITDSKKYIPTDNTTPDAPTVYRALRDASLLGARAAVIEVSSQALSGYRVFGIPFYAAVFTNFSRDHIGPTEHSTEEEYFRAKLSLFTDYGIRYAIINSADSRAETISRISPNTVTVSDDPEATLRVKIQGREGLGISFLLGDKPFYLPMGGEFNAHNAALAVASASVCFGRAVETFTEPIREFSLRGRYELYRLDGRMIVIDFAHNAESVSALCKSIRDYASGRLILVFGSVGERSKERRTMLAIAAETYGDISIITSDNPGFEDPEDICADILSAFLDSSHALVVTDREAAIKRAVELSSRGDFLLLLGKGHEDFQDIRGERVPFSERDIIERLGAVPIID